MMEDRRKASEDLFGDLMNFSAGPTQGQEADRLRSAIAWMESEFLSKLQDYLTANQLVVWKKSQEASSLLPETERGQPTERSQTQYVRINNNSFTSEDGGYRFSRSFARTAAPVQVTEVIPRGGAGSWHGNAEFLLKDDALNAGRRFAKNKPPYQERQISFDFSGPVIAGKLTSRFAFTQNEAENVDTIRATLPDRIFSLGITRPATTRSFNISNTVQLSDATSVSVNGAYSTTNNRNQGVGGFVMPDRAFRNSGRVWNFEIRQFSSLSSQKIYETRLNVSGSRDKTTPNTQAVQINVLDAFSDGGAQNDLNNNGRTVEVNNLYSQLGEKLTLKAGFSAIRRQNHSISQNMFLGAFTFSSIEKYERREPLMYRVNGGTPASDITQWETAFFVQSDFRVSPQLTAMYGARYELQTNMKDRNNIDGRIGFAYAPKRATVIRGGIGTFHQRVPMNHIENYRRRDGVQQYELIIDRPSFTDPLQSGAARNPSVRVINPKLVAPYNFVFLVSYEQTFFEHLIFSVAYDRNRETHRLRPRNLNAPMDITSPAPASCKPGQGVETCVRPFPGRGNIISLESSASDITHSFRVGVRERFSIFNVAANYTFNREWLDSVPASNLGINVGGPSGYGPDGLNSDQYNLAADWALIVSPKHNVETMINARLPGGIFLANTVNYRSHSKYTITTGMDDNSDTSVNDRPLGLPRSTAKAHNFIAFNFNVSKAVFIGSAHAGNGSVRSNINLFANMTNAFNRPNYAPPSGVMSSPNFGKSTSAGDQRKIEIGLRFQF
ncbi:MAG: hypothetical protein HY646_00885 [Acidobacteria bacterium]|nr:hypothetical protein [Acidobacteriota bacterium]